MNDEFGSKKLLVWQEMTFFPPVKNNPFDSFLKISKTQQINQQFGLFQLSTSFLPGLPSTILKK